MAFCYGSSRTLIQRSQVKASSYSARVADYLFLPQYPEVWRNVRRTRPACPPAHMMPYLHQHVLWRQGQRKCVGGPPGLLCTRTLHQEGETAPLAKENTPKPWKTLQSVLMQTQNSNYADFHFMLSPSMV